MKPQTTLNIIPVFLLVVILISGCATPEAVKSLSREQMTAQEQYLESQKRYFSLIEKFVEKQIQVTESLINEATKKINSKYKEKAFRSIDVNDQAKTKQVLDELAENVLTEYKSDQESLTRIKGYLSDLKKKHQEMLEAYSTILEAQKKLDEYIQLKKADEELVNQLLSIVGAERKKINRLINSTATIFDEIEKIIEGGSKK